MERKHRGIEQCLSSFSPNKKHLSGVLQGRNDGKLISRPRFFFFSCFRANTMHTLWSCSRNSVSFFYLPIWCHYSLLGSVICQMFSWEQMCDGKICVSFLKHSCFKTYLEPTPVIKGCDCLSPCQHTVWFRKRKKAQQRQRLCRPSRKLEATAESYTLIWIHCNQTSSASVRASCPFP